MGSIIAEWQSRKAEEAALLHEQIATAIAEGKVVLATDARVLDVQGSPVHSPWDNLAPLLILMLLALVILLSAGMAFGIVAMTIGALLHLTLTRYFVAWQIQRRTLAYMVESVAHWQAVWERGGVGILLKGSGELPCFAPLGDWRKFARRNLRTEAEPLPPREPEPPPPPPPQPQPIPEVIVPEAEEQREAEAEAEPRPAYTPLDITDDGR